MSYCTRDDVYNLALSAQAFVIRARPFDAVDGTTATIRLAAHGLSAEDVITFEGTDGGALPTGISAFTAYYPLPLTADLFQVALTSGGPALASWADVGEGWGIVVDTGRRLDLHIEQAASEIDEDLTADEPPIKVDPISGKFPQQLIGLNARMAARAMVNSLQFDNPAFREAVDRLFAREARDNEMRNIWRSGKPLNPRPTDQNTIPDNAAAATGGTAATWRTGTII